ncbi:hypothetical protein ACIQHY_10865 [Streptomyces sp. NPDC092359]|uniref:hypothetical protein n=1 Tax=Streptomyces sp. NPDC092359 TaxID=3366014 RepID=UPI00380EEFF1
MPEGDTPMRGSAAPTSPGARDARSEALLGTPAPPHGGAATRDRRGTGNPPDASPPGIAPPPARTAPPSGHRPPAPTHPHEPPAHPAGPPEHPPAPARPTGATPTDPTTPAHPATDPTAAAHPTAAARRSDAVPALPVGGSSAPGPRPEPTASTYPADAGSGHPAEGRSWAGRRPESTPPAPPAAAPPVLPADRSRAPGHRPATAPPAHSTDAGSAAPADAPSAPVRRPGPSGRPAAVAPPPAPGPRPDAVLSARPADVPPARPAATRPVPPVAPARPRQGPADPVKVLLHRQRELCARAVDPLEIAAGLEAQGFTDRTAARFRHRDVFALAEELYARVPQADPPPAPPAPRPSRPDAWLLGALAPGAAAALTCTGLALTHGPARTATGAAGALLLAARRGPFRAPEGHGVPAARLWTLWLLAYAAGGDGLLTAILSGGPDGPWELSTGPLLALALAVAPAAWCARLFADRARRRITRSRGLADFAVGIRPLLVGTLTLPLLALTALLALTGFSPGALALGALLLFARLLTVHGHPGTAAATLAAACAAEALALTSVLASRLPLPGFDALATPVRAAVDTWGPGAVPTLVCGAAALGLLAHATGSLVRASAHATR